MKMNELNQRIEALKEQFKGNPKALLKSMKTVKWVMFCPQLNLWAKSGLQIKPAKSQSEATVFDGRDNAEMKIRFFRAVTGIDWQVQVLP